MSYNPFTGSPQVAGTDLSHIKSLDQFMWQDDIVSVVRFVAECLDILQSAVAASHQP
jgi:hypothetical protein